LNESCFVVTLRDMEFDGALQNLSTLSFISERKKADDWQTTVRQSLRDARSILVCLRYGIGDVVMQFPILEALRHAVPKARITALGAEPALELLDGSGFVDEVVAFRRWGIRHFWEAADEGAVSGLVGWLAVAAFELVLDAEFAPTSICDAVERAQLRALSTDHSAVLAALARGGNSAEALSRGVWSGWGLPVDSKARPSLALSDAEVRFAQALLSRDQRRPSPFVVGVCPTASSKLKRWPEERFAVIADWAIDNGHRAVLLEGHLDPGAPGMQRLMSYPHSVLVIRKLHLRRVAAVLAECSVLVCNDTGLMHIAAAVGTPVIAVFGPTSHSVYLPRGHAVGLSGDINCPHRTYNMDPPGCWASEHCLIAPRSCTAAVSVESVIKALQAVLANQP
jgi:ADP-heptose:LPS heptosyltransferase